MHLKLHVHPAAEGGFWAEVPALPGCISEGETMAELLANTREAVRAWLEEAEQADELRRRFPRRRVVELEI